MGPLTDIEGAKQIARSLVQYYGKSKSNELSKNDIVPMMSDIQKTVKNQYEPTQEDIDGLKLVLDHNNDGRITIEDIEELAILYLTENPGSHVLQKTTQPVQNPQQTINFDKLNGLGKKWSQIAEKIFRETDIGSSQGGNVEGAGDDGIDINEVGPLLERTYKTMDASHPPPTQQEIQDWMNLTDTNEDGKVDLKEYKILVLGSLKKCGIKVEED